MIKKTIFSSLFPLGLKSFPKRVKRIKPITLFSSSANSEDLDKSPPPKKKNLIKAEECYKYEPAWGNIYLIRHLKFFLKRPYALPLIQEIELYIFGKEFNKRCLKTDSICIKFNLFALHVWLLSDRLKSFFRPQAFFMRRSLMRLFEEYTQDMVYSFQDFFDKDVHQELSRMHRTLFYALDDWFYYGFKQRSLENVLAEDLFLEEKSVDSEEIKLLMKYINQQVCLFRSFSTEIKSSLSKRAYLAGLSFEVLNNQEIEWGKEHVESNES